MRRSNLHTELVEDAHAYTRSSVPWKITGYSSAYGKLIHYISGGGMRTFGRTVRQEEVRMRQVRFGIVLACLWALWLAFLVF